MNELVAALLFRKVGRGYPEPTGSIDITENGVTDVKNYAEANVNVPNSYASSDNGKVVDNGTLVSQTAKNIVENGTHDTTTNNSVVVNVANSYTESDNGKVVDNGALVAQTQKAISANGTVDTTLNNEVVVSVSNSYSQSDEGKVVENGALVSQTAKNIAENGTFDTTKNNSVVVDVPNPSSGSLEITKNGTYDVTEKASAVVNVPNPSSGSLKITANGTYNVKSKAKVVVNVPNTYAAGDEGKVVQSGALIAQTQKSVNANGTYDTTANNSVVVNVEGGSSILFATNATYGGEPIQGNTCSAEVPSADLSSYSAGDVVVLYGEEPNSTGKNFLVKGTISSIDTSSGVTFSVDEVSDLSSGSSDKGGFVVLNDVGGDDNPAEGVTIDVYMTSQEVDGVNVGDSLLAKGAFTGGEYVLFGKVTEKGDEYVKVSVIKAMESDNEQSTWVVDCSADNEPSGEDLNYITVDSSTAANMSQNDLLIGQLTAGGVDYAFYGQVDSVVDLEKGEVEVFMIAFMEIPFS